MIINLWLVIRDDAQVSIKERLDWDEEIQDIYTGPITERQYKLFKLMTDTNVVQRLFRLDNDGTNDWILWSLYFNYTVDILLKIQSELDTLIAAYPNHVKIIGAWDWSGNQIGYPIHLRILEFIPDTIIYDTTGSEISRARPTIVKDMNLLFGQSPRNF